MNVCFERRKVLKNKHNFKCNRYMLTSICSYLLLMKTNVYETFLRLLRVNGQRSRVFSNSLKMALYKKI